MRAGELKDIYPEKDVLYWLGPDLARAGLLKNEPWVEQNARAAVAMFGNNQGLQINASVLAVTHQYAIDYLKQAPVLAIAATRGVCLRKTKTRVMTASRFCSLIKDGPRLKDVLRKYRVAYPFRALFPYAVSESAWRTILVMSQENPSLVAQCVPKRPRAQRRWISALTSWIERAGMRSGSFSPGLTWAMRAYGNMAESEAILWPSHDGSSIADFYIAATQPSAQPIRWSDRWSLQAAAERCEQWHNELSRQNEQERCKTKYGLEYDQPIDYGSLPTEWKIPLKQPLRFSCDPVNDHIKTSVAYCEFIALRSCAELHAEGRAMHNCVVSYFSDVVSGRSRLYSVRSESGKRLATMELRKRAIAGVEMVQLKGPCNTAPTDTVKRACTLFVAHLNKRS